jgi:hypothetical protein
MIPSTNNSIHINFPRYFEEHNLITYFNKLFSHDHSLSPQIDIVLNFEKCQWFEMQPLTILLNYLLSLNEPRPKLHIVGPSTSILPYMKKYLKYQKEKANTVQLLDRYNLLHNRHTVSIPEQRLKAGAFLVGWGFFDFIEDYYVNCMWYLSREINVSFRDFLSQYQFAYGSNAPSDRIWPFTPVFRNDEKIMIERLNGGEILTGALRKFKDVDIIENGSTVNVLYFEPFENVFQHAFLDLNDNDAAVISARLTTWMHNSKGEILPRALYYLSKMPKWFADYILKVHRPFMEIVITDFGVGIPRTLGNKMLSDNSFLKNISESKPYPLPATSYFNWCAIKYAFEDYSTRKTDGPPGKRGLSWVRNMIIEIGGMAQIISNGTSYVFYGHDNEIVELEYAKINNANNSPENKCAQGTSIKIIIPLDEKVTDLRRFPKWREAPSQKDLFKQKRKLVSF